MEYTIIAIWDSECAVWTATSPDVAGLCLESGSLDALIERVKIAVPELLELNSKPEKKQFSLNFNVTRKEMVAV